MLFGTVWAERALPEVLNVALWCVSEIRKIT